eukprot:gb/GECG01001432.1/.p1 GENE.gb/GECG01001432.1/~~gb/GECG01001432.1/.p1  ORF type:complete len:1015 (+),score=100.27 gb/GECG01001432.1/:1-3045(+)
MSTIRDSPDEQTDIHDAHESCASHCGTSSGIELREQDIEANKPSSQRRLEAWFSGARGAMGLNPTAKTKTRRKSGQRYERLGEDANDENSHEGNDFQANGVTSPTQQLQNSTPSRTRLSSSWSDHGVKLRSPSQEIVTQRKRASVPRKAMMNRVESSDFDPYESRMFVENHKSRRDVTGPTVEDPRRIALIRWVLLFFIACFTALTAVLITFVSKHLGELKFDAIQKVIAGRERTKGTLASAGVAYVSIAVGFGSVAALMATAVERKAAGSGISEIKCVLNGIRLPRVVRLRTLFAKVIGIVFAVSSGLPVGKEGPMIHSGAIIGAGASQGRRKLFGIDTSRFFTVAFRNDREKRDFVSCGASAGVAAAFGAPVGGVLFALEEGSSYWSKALTWRSFFCAIISTYVLDVFLSGMNEDSKWGELSAPGMFTFGDFNSTGQNRYSWKAWEIPIFLLMGIIGGLFGALFVSANKRLTVYRMNNSATRLRRFSEAVGVTALVAVLTFILPVIFSKCLRQPKEDAPSADAHLVQFFCSKGYYNPVATFFFAPSESAIQQLFHLRKDDFTLGNLVLFFFVYGSLTCLTYGIAVPSGLFIPSLLTGSAFGRFVGQAMVAVSGGHIGIDPGTYSLIGAAAFLGGVTRMTISLAVILLESTGNYQYGLPLMLVFFSARWTGNVFNDGIYDVHIALNKWPLLEEKLPKDVAWELTTEDVMTSPPVVLREVETVERILKVLKCTKNNGFPVIFNAGAYSPTSKIGTFAGLIQRKHLSVLLAHKAFQSNPPTVTIKRALVETVPKQHSKIQDESETSRLEEVLARVTLTNWSLSKPDRNNYLDQELHTHKYKAGELSLTEEDIREDLQNIPVRFGEEQYTVVPSFSDNKADSSTAARNGSGNGTVWKKASLIYGENYTDVQHLNQYSPDFDRHYPRFPSVDEMVFSDEELKSYVDLRPYMSSAPYTVNYKATLQRTYSLFRGLGLRHLPVLNDCQDVIGIITRHELTEDQLEIVLHRKQANYPNCP